jgi:hypothetical protein
MMPNFDGPAAPRQRDVDFDGSSPKADILKRQNALYLRFNTLSLRKYVSSDSESAECLWEQTRGNRHLKTDIGLKSFFNLELTPSPPLLPYILMPVPPWEQIQNSDDL